MGASWVRLGCTDALHLLYAKYDQSPAGGISAGAAGDADGADADALEPAGADELWAIGSGKAVDGGFWTEVEGGCEFKILLIEMRVKPIVGRNIDVRE